MTKEFSFIETNRRFHEGMKLEEYKGKISLASGKLGDKGSVWYRWVYPQGKNRVPGEKAIPLKIQLGDSRQEAAANLRRLIDDLEG